ncbi:protein lifeguard 1-like [Bolinopsis microptera]|uniref:protein lifeguard 1-like n=1 Tax=Bolinopsis microptera TaxID=2820187 RepID=UPI003078CAC0
MTQLQGGHYDEESNLVISGASTAFDDQSVRRGFIRKVYAILIAMLTLTFTVIIAFTTIPVLRTWGQTRVALLVFVVLWLSAIVLMIVLICNESLRRSYPQNAIFLVVMTLIFSFALGITASYSKPFIVLVAIATTLGIVIALTIFAFQTKYDFTILTGILFCVSISLLVFVILVVLLHSRVLYLVYATLGACLISIYIVVDTQIMMSGKTVQLDPEEYVFAALNLYVDIIMLFSYVLVLCGGGNQ